MTVPLTRHVEVGVVPETVLTNLADASGASSPARVDTALGCAVITGAPLVTVSVALLEVADPQVLVRTTETVTPLQPVETRRSCSTTVSVPGVTPTMGLVP